MAEGMGIEHPAKTEAFSESGAESGALGVQQPAFDVSADFNLARLIEAWPTLPDAIKSVIAAMVATAGRKK